MLNETVLTNPLTADMLEVKSTYTVRALEVVEAALRDLGPSVMVYGSRAYQVYTDPLLCESTSDWDVMTWDVEQTITILLERLRTEIPDRVWSLRQRVFSIDTFEIVSFGRRNELTLNNIVDVTNVPDVRFSLIR